MVGCGISVLNQSMWYNQIPPAWAFPVMRSLENLYFNEIELLSCRNIHPKRWFPRFQESADNFEFSAERLSEIAKSIKITLFAELLTVISPNYVQSLLNFSMKTLKHSIFSKKCPIHTKFFVAIYALFPQIFWNWKAQSADFIAFRMYDKGLWLKSCLTPCWPCLTPAYTVLLGFQKADWRTRLLII